MQNSVDDLYSYFKFIRQAPYDDASSFRSLIREPIAKSPDLGFKRLQTILQAVMLRRTKTSKIDGKPIVNLPQRLVELETGALLYRNPPRELRPLFIVIFILFIAIV